MMSTSMLSDRKPRQRKFLPEPFCKLVCVVLVAAFANATNPNIAYVTSLEELISHSFAMPACKEKRNDDLSSPRKILVQL